MHGLTGGMDMPAAALVAGYASPENAREAYAGLRYKMVQEMAECGIGLRGLALQLKGKLEAKETRLFSKDGLITDAIELDDHRVQIKAIELASDILGLRDNGNSGASVGAINILCHSGAMPTWAGAQVSNPADGVLTSIPAIPNSNSGAAVRKSKQRVQKSKLAERVGISTVEGTGSGPAAPTHTHSTDLAAASVLTRPQQGLTAQEASLLRRQKRDQLRAITHPPKPVPVPRVKVQHPPACEVEPLKPRHRTRAAKV
jgi:hypothetical protein